MQIQKDIEDQYENKLYNLLKRFAFISRQFCDKYCVPDGLLDIMMFNLYGLEITDDVLYQRKLFCAL